MVWPSLFQIEYEVDLKIDNSCDLAHQITPLTIRMGKGLNRKCPSQSMYIKILQIKKREYRDGIKSRETRPGWCEAHNIYKACVGTTEGF